MGEKSLNHYPDPDPNGEVHEPQVMDPQQEMVDGPASSEVDLDGLPPIPTGDSQPLSENVAKPRTTTDPQQKMVDSLNSASNSALIAIGTGLIGFAGGIAIAVLILNGVIDLQAQWVKDIVSMIRGS
jgi:hypothetical protein